MHSAEIVMLVIVLLVCGGIPLYVAVVCMRDKLYRMVDERARQDARRVRELQREWKDNAHAHQQPGGRRKYMQRRDEYVWWYWTCAKRGKDIKSPWSYALEA